MSRRGKQIIESDSEEEHDADKMQDDEDSMDEEDVDDELNLPKELINSVSLKEKRELLHYKQTHNELEWENEMMTRIEGLSKKKDMERLRMMTTAATTAGEEDSGTAKKKKKDQKKAPAPAPSKKYPKGRERKRYDDDDDELEDEEDFEEESEADEEEDDDEEEGSDMDVEDEDSDDLFDEDELVTISKQTKALKKSGGKQLRAAPAKKTATRKRSRLEDYDSSDDEDRLEDENKDDWGEAHSEDEDDRKGRGLKKSKKYKRREEEEDTSELAELEDILKIQSRRVLLEQWHAEPYFANVVQGSFVRYCVGNSATGAATYRMAEVLDVVTLKPYKLPDANVMTERGLLIAVGTQQTEAKMYKVSNSRITQREYDEWRGVLQKASLEHMLMRKKTVEKRRAKIRTASQHTYTHEEVAAMIQKNGMKTTKHTSNFSHAMGMMKKEFERARGEGDFENMEKIQKEMDKLDREMSASRAEFARRYEANTNINQRNKMRNIQMDMEAGVRRREMDKQKTKEEKRKDPFARRDTRPTILWVTGQNKGGKDGGAEEQKGPDESSQPAAEDAKQQAAEQEEESIVHTEQYNSMEEIGKRIQKKFGFNPHAAAAVDKRTKYLEEECRRLPPLGAEERHSVRQGISLVQYLQRVSEQMVE